MKLEFVPLLVKLCRKYFENCDNSGNQKYCIKQYMYGRDTVLSGRFLFPVQAALGAADASVPAPRTPAKYIGGEIRVKHDLGFTSISMAYSAPGGADTSK